MVGAMKEELVCYLVLTHKLFHQNIAQEVQMLWGTYLVKHGCRHFPDRCILSCSFFVRVNLWPSPIRDSSQGPTNSKSQIGGVRVKIKVGLSRNQIKVGL
ncbi:hypothetical protein QQP08_011358, partial [Theobroma cacao]